MTKEYIANFTDNGDCTVKHNTTGLVWQKYSQGQSNDSNCSSFASSVNWLSALSYCNSLTLVGRTWRLPNINELFTLLDTTKDSEPPITITYFPNPDREYWSSTTSASDPTLAWYLDFDDGEVLYESWNKNTPLYVRCVSGP